MRRNSNIGYSVSTLAGRLATVGAARLFNQFIIKLTCPTGTGFTPPPHFQAVSKSVAVKDLTSTINFSTMSISNHIVEMNLLFVCKRDKTSIKIDKTFSIKDEAFNKKDETFSIKDETFIKKVGTFSIRDKTFSKKDETFSIRDEAFSIKDETFSIRDGTFIKKVRSNFNNI